MCVVENERGREVVSESGGGSGDVAKVKMSTLEVRDSFVSARGESNSIRDGTSNERSEDEERCKIAKLGVKRPALSEGGIAH